MKIIVCIKQVPAIHDVSIDPDTKRLKREGIKSVMNPFDLYAVEAAIELREKLGGETIAISMGPTQAEWCLREALSMGIDRAFLLSDKAFAGSDTWATSYTLAAAIRHLKECDLVICGKQAVDGDTAQVGPGIAAHLQWRQITYVSEIMDAFSDTLHLNRMYENGHFEVELPLPAVITVVKDINQPRIPRLRNALTARKAEVPVLTADQLNISTDFIGLNGSPTRVVKTAPPPARAAATKRISGSSEECADELLKELRNKGLL
ncbi:MAG: electron transfer flavoprotein subunit beta/FixA family protein [Lentisphaeria bacterium]